MNSNNKRHKYEVGEEVFFNGNIVHVIECYFYGNPSSKENIRYAITDKDFSTGRRGGVMEDRLSKVLVEICDE